MKFDHLEKVVDRFDDIANVMHGIVIGTSRVRSGHKHDGCRHVGFSAADWADPDCAGVRFSQRHERRCQRDRDGRLDPCFAPALCAVAWAAFSSFIAFLVFGLHVAETVGRGIVQADIIDERVIFGALAGAITWQIITNRLGIPSSSSHALIGGLVGAGLAKAGISAVVWQGVFKTIGGIVLAPGLGCVLALFLMLLVSWIFVRFTPYGVDNFFRRAQLVSAACYALGHGGNDAQKTMGIIAVLLYSQGYLGSKFYVPFSVVIACQAAIAIGSPAAGVSCTRWAAGSAAHSVRGFCAEAGARSCCSRQRTRHSRVHRARLPARLSVSAPQKGVRWCVGACEGIVTAWIITIPASAAVAALIYGLSGFLADQAARRREGFNSRRSSTAAASRPATP
jgi:PiT family inorganic phosphate transporter